MRPVAKSSKDRSREDGFTLIELLVVMIIIGILASIAIPVFLNQRKKAFDTATKSDVTRLGKEVAAFYVDGSGALTVDTTTLAGSATVKSGGVTFSSIQLTEGSVLQAVPYKATALAERTTCAWR